MVATMVSMRQLLLVLLLSPALHALTIPRECECSTSPLSPKTVDYILQLTKGQTLSSVQCNFLCHPSEYLTEALDQALPHSSTLFQPPDTSDLVTDPAAATVAAIPAPTPTFLASKPRPLFPIPLAADAEVDTDDPVEPPPLFDPINPHPPPLFFAPSSSTPASLLPRPPIMPASRMERLPAHEAAVKHRWDDTSPYRPSKTWPDEDNAITRLFQPAHASCADYALRIAGALVFLLFVAAGMVVGGEVAARVMRLVVRRRRRAALLRRRRVTNRRATTGGLGGEDEKGRGWGDGTDGKEGRERRSKSIEWGRKEGEDGMV